MIEFRLTPLLAALLLAVSCAAFGQDGPPPPDPVQLDANWWTYFQPGPENSEKDLGERIETAITKLRALPALGSAASDDELAPLVDTVAARLERYGEYAALEQPVMAPARAARESYTLAEISALVDDMRRAAVERSSEAQDIANLDRAIEGAERQQSQRKVAYLALDPAAPERPRRGLELMQTRLQLELARRELRFRNARLEGLESELANLQTLLGAAANRISADDGAIEQISKARDEVLRQLDSLREELARLELAESSALTLEPLDQARAQRQAQHAMAVEAQTLTLDLRAEQLAVSRVLLERAASDNSLDTVPHRKLLREFEAEIENARQRMRQIRDETVRARTATLRRVATEENAELAQLLRERIDAADETDRQIAALSEQISVSEQFGVLLSDQLKEAEGTLGHTIQLLRDGTAEAWTSVSTLVSASLFEISETPVTTLGLLRMILIMTLAWWVSKFARRGLMSVATRRNSVNQGSIYTLSRMLHYGILAIGIMIALSSIGIDFTKFALFASALGVGIGFGLQTLVSNFVAGLIILFEKSLKIGDFVELESGVTGEVKEINMRSTLVTTNDNIDIVVPNSEFVNSRVTNWTMREVYRRMRIPFGVAYGTDKEVVKKAVLEAAGNVDLTLIGHKRREPQVWFVEFGDSSLNFELVVWLTPDAVKRPGAVHAAYLWAIDDKLREYDIEVPFPQRDLHLRSVFGIREEEGSAMLRERARPDAAD